MRKSPTVKPIVFWTLISLMFLVVISITTGTYMQYKLADAISEPQINTGTIFTVVQNTKSIFYVIGTFF